MSCDRQNRANVTSQSLLIISFGPAAAACSLETHLLASRHDVHIKPCCTFTTDDCLLLVVHFQ